MKIAHVNMFFLPTFGGVEQVMYELASRQVKQGHEVHVFCCDSDKNKIIEKKEEIIDGIHIHRLPYWFRLSLNTFIWPSLFWRFKGDFDVRNARISEHPKNQTNKPDGFFDIVHTHVSGHLYILLMGMLSKIKGFKHIHTTHCPWTDASFRPFILRPFLFLNNLFFNRLSFRMIDKIIAITPWEMETLNKFVEDKKKIKVIPNGVDKILFKKVNNNKFKKTHNIKEKNMVLFFGRLNPTKGPEKLALAAINITKKRKDIAFVWIGPDEGKAQEVKELIKGHRNMHYLGPIRGKGKIAEMYQASDVFVLPSYREGLPLCCHPNTLIETKDGLKEINKIELHEMVLTHTGKFCEVTKIGKRNIDEEIICIKPWGINQEIKITKEHPVLAIKRPKKKFKKSIGKIITQSAPIWVKSQDLNEGDCVVFPIPKYDNNVEYFDLTNFDSSLEYSPNQVWYKNGFSGKKKDNSYFNIMKKTGETKKVIEMAVSYLKDGNFPPKSERINRILRFLKENQFDSAKTNKYPRFIKIDEKLAYVFGWYIAEGSAGKGFIRFALNKKEIEYAKEIDEIINNKFNIKGRISIKDNKLSLVFCGQVLVNLFSKLCGKGAENKRIPYQLFNQKLLPNLLKGLFLGDGHFNNQGWHLSTISRQLANDTMLALLILRKKFNFHKPKRNIYFVSYQLNNLNISHSNKSWFIDNAICFMIRKIKREKYCGEVYNLEVKDDNSYTTSSFSVHNCLFEAMASGLPIVASPVNGVPYEMKENDNGFFANYGDLKKLEENIIKLIDNKKLANKISLNNKIKARQYDWDTIFKRYMNEYKLLLKKKR